MCVYIVCVCVSVYVDTHIHSFTEHFLCWAPYLHSFVESSPSFCKVDSYSHFPDKKTEAQQG